MPWSDPLQRDRKGGSMPTTITVPEANCDLLGANVRIWRTYALPGDEPLAKSQKIPPWHIGHDIELKMRRF